MKQPFLVAVFDASLRHTRAFHNCPSGQILVQFADIDHIFELTGRFRIKSKLETRFFIMRFFLEIINSSVIHNMFYDECGFKI